MSYDPSRTKESRATDPDKGLRTRPYLISLLVGLVVILGLAMMFLLKPGRPVGPPANKSPASQSPSPSGTPH